MRRLSGAAIAALTIALAGCSALEGPSPSPTPPGEPAALPRPIAAAGAMGEIVEVGPLSLTVVSAALWPQEEQTLGPDVRGLSVLVRLASSSPGLELEASDFQLVDAVSGARYAAGARPGSADLRLPVMVGGTPVQGILSFTPPRIGTYSLRVAVSPTASGTVELGRLRTGIPTATVVAAPSDAPTPAPSLAAELEGCVKIVGGRWNPVGDENKAPALLREYVEIASTCTTPSPMGGWLLTDKWRQNAFTFPADFVLDAGKSVRIYSGTGRPSASRLYFGRTSKEVWDNEAPETAYLKDAEGTAVSTYSPY